MDDRETDSPTGGRTERSRRSHRRRSLLALAGSGLFAGCLRLTDSGGAGSPASSTPTDGAGTETTPVPTQDSTATENLRSAEFAFDYRQARSRLTIEFTGGARPEAGDVLFRSSDGTEAAWSDLGSTTQRPGDRLEPGATAALGPSILNWEEPVGPGETIRLLFTGEQSPILLTRFTPSATATGAQGGTKTEDTPVSDTTTETPDTSTNVFYGSGRLATFDTRTHVSTMIHVEFGTATEISDSVKFHIENVDTGESVSVSVESDRSVPGRDVAFLIYTSQGALVTERGREPVASVTRADTDDYQTARLDVTVDGDDSTFSEQSLAEYRVTMFDQGVEIDSTGTQAFPIGHEKEFESSVSDGTVSWSFDAGDLAADTIHQAQLRTDDDSVSADDVRLDDSTGRFVAEVSADSVPTGTHEGVIMLRDPETDVWLLKLSGQVTV